MSKSKKAGVIGKYIQGGNISFTPEELAALKQILGNPQQGIEDPLPGVDPYTKDQPISLGKDLSGPGNDPGKTSFGSLLGSELTKHGGVATLLGGIETGLANAPGYAPDPTEGALGGAMSGAGVGLSIGGPLGGLVGAGVGGLFGWANSGSKLGTYNDLLMNQDKQRVKDRTIDPYLGVRYAEDGGKAQGTEVVPVQTEIGEIVFLPSSRTLSDVKAVLKHSQMDTDDITDILPSGAVVFSNSKDNMFNITDIIRDESFGYGRAFYSEHENLPVEEVTFGDHLPDKKVVTFAEAADYIKDEFSTVKDIKDIFANITNSENKEARLPYLSKLFSLQQEVTGKSGLQNFEKGGKVKKMPDGGIVDLLNKYKQFLSDTKNNIETENTDQKNAYDSLQSRLTGDNILANGVISPLGYLLQDPYVKPAHVDTTLSGAMFRPSSNAGIKNVASTGIAESNSLTQELLRNGVNPTDAISMTAGDRSRAIDSSNDITLKSILNNEALDREKYKFLSGARTANEAADVEAYNKTTDNQNKAINGLSEAGQTLVKGDAAIQSASTDWRTARAKHYYENLANLGEAGLGLDTKLFQTEALQNSFDNTDKSLSEQLNKLQNTDNGPMQDPLGIGINNPVNDTPVGYQNPPVNTNGDLSYKPNETTGGFNSGIIGQGDNNPLNNLGKGADVQHIQHYVNSIFPDKLATDGIMGNKTFGAISGMANKLGPDQKDNVTAIQNYINTISPGKLNVDGKFGNKTAQALINLLSTGQKKNALQMQKMLNKVKPGSAKEDGILSKDNLIKIQQLLKGI